MFPMETHLDMGTIYIYNVMTPINNDQGVNKSYADTKLITFWWFNDRQFRYE